MKHRAGAWKRYALVVLMVCLASGCLSRKRRIPPSQQPFPAQTLTRAELLQRLQDRSGAIRSMTASVAFLASGGGIDTGEITDWRETTASILVERPGRIRVIVKLPVLGTTLADMVSDGLRFNLSIPPKNRWITGDSNAPGTASRSRRG